MFTAQQAQDSPRGSVSGCTALVPVAAFGHQLAAAHPGQPLVKDPKVTETVRSLESRGYMQRGIGLRTDGGTR